jgi:ATP-binding cassette, subfamily C, bacterial EexD
MGQTVEQGHQSGAVEGGQPARPTVARSDNVIRSITKRNWLPFLAVMFFSMVLNLLALAAPLYMIQVYDRVLTSRSIATLVAMFGLVCAIYLVQALLDYIRARALWRLSLRFDRDYCEHLFHAELAGALAQTGKGVGQSALRELETVRQFVASPGMTLLFDVPWVPIYIAALFVINYYLGLFAVAGVLLLVVLAIINESAVDGAQREANQRQAEEQQMTAAVRHSAETIKALGMYSAIAAVWQAKHNDALVYNGRSIGRSIFFSSMSRSSRMFLQSAVLTVGAVLVIQDQITGGMIIAATTLFSRAVQPLDQLIAQWRSVARARAATLEIGKLLTLKGPFTPKLRLPTPTGHLVVDDLRVVVPSTQRMILKRQGGGPGVTFELLPGESMGIVGPSGAGKTTIARVLAGTWPAAGVIGRVELDGMAIHKWDAHQLGAAIGFLPQEVNLISGTVKQNISRFDPNADDAKINEAAVLCGVHRLIADLPEGYDTEVGPMGSALSAGQRQRIGLARAVYNNPCLLILDEPNSNLDNVGEDALNTMMVHMKERQCSVIVISHRPDVIKTVDKLLVMGRGEPMVFGPASEVMAKLRFMGRKA